MQQQNHKCGASVHAKMGRLTKQNTLAARSKRQKTSSTLELPSRTKFIFFVWSLFNPFGTENLLPQMHHAPPIDNKSSFFVGCALKALPTTPLDSSFATNNMTTGD